MPDITMCKGTDCPAKDTCYRAQATPSERQSYFADSPRYNNNCDHYVGVNEGTQVGLQFIGVEYNSGEGEFELTINAAVGTIYLSREMWDEIASVWDAHRKG